MEIQRNLFRLSEKLLSSPTTAKFLRYLFFQTLILSILFAAIFGFGMHNLKLGTGKLNECITSNNQLRQKLLSADSLVTVLFQDQTSLNHPDKKYHIADGASCNVYQNVPGTPTSGVIFTQTYSLPNLSDKVRQKYQFDNYTVIIYTQSLEWYYVFYNEFDLVVNELLEDRVFNLTVLYAKMANGEGLYFNKMEDVGKVKAVLGGFVGLIILDVVSLLYIYSTIVSAPAFLIALIDMFNLHNTISRLNVYKVFPWIGLYMHPLDRRPGHNTSSKYIAHAMLAFFLFIYFIYLGSMTFISRLLFLNPVHSGLGQNYFGFIAIIQFICLLLLRTRTSIKYYPACYVCIQMTLIFYCSYVRLGYKNWLFACDIAMTLCVLSVLLLKVEVPATTTWNKGMWYTPTENRPRVMYFPSFNLLWMNDIPDLWTMCVPMFGRGFFRQEELAVVDRDYELLRGTMRTHELID